MGWVRWAASALVLLQGVEDGSGVRFRDRGPGSGIDYVNVSGELEKRLIVSTLGSGVALLDYDEDGDLDVYLANGQRIDGDRVVGSHAERLYRNDGGLVFTDVTAAAGLGDDGFGVGVAVADFDADGLADLLVTRLGPKPALSQPGRRHLRRARSQRGRRRSFVEHERGLRRRRRGRETPTSTWRTTWSSTWARSRRPGARPAASGSGSRSCAGRRG